MTDPWVSTPSKRVASAAHHIIGRIFHQENAAKIYEAIIL